MLLQLLDESALSLVNVRAAFQEALELRIEVVPCRAVIYRIFHRLSISDR